MQINGMKILVVDDYDAIRALIRKELINQGASLVIDVKDGDKAWTILNSGQTFDLVLSDWNMPNLSGFELLKMVRQDKNLKKMPFILITAEADRSAVSNAIVHRVSDFLIKPFTLKHLLERIMLLNPDDTISESVIDALLDTDTILPTVVIDSPLQLAGSSILIVDDTATNLDVIVGALNGFYDVKAAKSAEIARRVLAKTNIDLILLDVMMPHEDGFEFCRWLKGDERYKDIPIIFLTAKTQPEEIVSGLELGAVDYISKPAHPEVLKARVKTHLMLYKSSKALIQTNISLNNAIEQSEQSDRMMRHDLKNPLSNILMETEISDSETFSSLKDRIRSMRANAKQAVSQIDSTLALYRLERGFHRINRKDVRYIDFIKPLKSDMNNLANKSGVKIKWLDPALDTMISIDSVLTLTMLTNLIKNAIEASQESNVVSIGFVSETFRWNIHNPASIDPDFLPNFFKKNATHGKEGGNGLGTYSAKLIASAHNGKILLSSSNNKGTTVIVEYDSKTLAS